MENSIKMKYVAPEVIDFQWMEGIGACQPTGSTPDNDCLAGGDAGMWACIADGNIAGSQCSNNGNVA